MSIKDQIAELEKQKQQLIEKAHKEAMKKVETAIAELNELGFNYKLSGASVSKPTGTRRTGVRQDVLAAIKASPGIAPADIAKKLGMEDKAGKQSIANALSALKKSGEVTATDGTYKAK